MTHVFTPDFPAEIVEEGRVRVVVPKLKAFVKLPSEYAPSKAPVFYNPIMELNRDIAVLAMQAHQREASRGISLCEPLTGCGLRGVRFAAEVKGVREVVISDINKRAYRLACHNVMLNNVAERVTVHEEEANLVMTTRSAPCKRFDAIDIDPFGSPVPYLDSAMRALRDKGMIALTATDMASLCGVYPKACIRKYGGKPLRTEYCHELAVRLLAGCLATIAAKHDIGIDLVFSHRGEHYIRLYAKIKYGAKKADESIAKIGFVLHCFNCFHREALIGVYGAERSKICSECGSSLSVGGPLWLGKLSDDDFCALIEQEAQDTRLKLGTKIRKMLSLIRGESNGSPTYFVVDKLCDRINVPVPPVKDVIQAIRREGYEASSTHFSSRGIRSDVEAIKLTKIVQELVQDTSLARSQTTQPR